MTKDAPQDREDSNKGEQSAKTPAQQDKHFEILWNVFDAKHVDSSALRSWLKANQTPAEKEFIEKNDSLRAEINTLLAQLRKTSKENAAHEKTSRELEEKLKEYERNQEVAAITTRINSLGRDKVFKNTDFAKHFESGSTANAFVVSVDIRRSTALMLKAREPRHFADFVNGLCNDFIEIVKRNNGVFDKFTGDGILCFFPDFYSGVDAGYLALRTAFECHDAFARRYKAARNSFTSVLVDAGLGVGIDFGQVSLLQMADGITVVGVPVVYACRLGGAPPNCTYLNQPAFEQIQERVPQAFLVSEESLEIKHEGAMLAYSMKPSGVGYTPAPPIWQTDGGKSDK